MIDTKNFNALAYVTAVAPSVGIDLPPARLAELAEAFTLVMTVAAPALSMDVLPEAEPAPVFVA